MPSTFWIIIGGIVLVALFSCIVCTCDKNSTLQNIFITIFMAFVTMYFNLEMMNNSLSKQITKTIHPEIWDYIKSHHNLFKYYENHGDHIPYRLFSHQYYHMINNIPQHIEKGLVLHTLSVGFVSALIFYILFVVLYSLYRKDTINNIANYVEFLGGQVTTVISAYIAVLGFLNLIWQDTSLGVNVDLIAIMIFFTVLSIELIAHIDNN